MKWVYDDTTKRLMRLIQNVRCESALEEEPGSCPDRKYGRCKMTDKLDGCVVETMVNGMIAAGVVIPVRCEKCKYAVGHDEIHKTVKCQKRSAYPKQWDDMPFNGFCSYGERREGE